MLLKIYHGALDKPWSIVWPLLPNYPEKKKSFARWTDLVQNYFKAPIVEPVSDPAVADYFLLPYFYNSIRNDRDYLLDFIKLAEQHKKKIIIIFPGDSTEEIFFTSAIVLRNSQYKSKQRINEIIMPAVAEDLGFLGLLEPRQKNQKPVIGFCGWADFRTKKERLKYYLKIIFRTGPHRLGLYWRRRTLALLEKSYLVKTNFIVRRSYSGIEKTITIDKDQARREYVENIINSDFTLCPRGDGNFSVRFFETLSLGRIPILLDTDCPLPLEKVVDYDNFIVRVDYRELNKISDILVTTYKSWSNEEYVGRQKRAHQAFEDYLRLDKFFEKVLTKDFLCSYDI